MATVIKGDAPEVEKSSTGVKAGDKAEEPAAASTFPIHLEEDALRLFQEYMSPQDPNQLFGLYGEWESFRNFVDVLGQVGLQAIEVKPCRLRKNLSAERSMGEFIDNFVLGKNAVQYGMLPGHEQDFFCYFLATNVGRSMDQAQVQELLKDEKLLRQYFPGVVDYQNFVTGKKFEKGHAYLGVLSMNPALRPLAAVALGKRMANNAGTKLPFPPDLRTFAQECLPSLEEVTTVAREYKVKDVLPTLKEIQRVHEVYRKTWRD